MCRPKFASDGAGGVPWHWWRKAQCGGVLSEFGCWLCPRHKMSGCWLSVTVRLMAVHRRGLFVAILPCSALLCELCCFVMRWMIFYSLLSLLLASLLINRLSPLLLGRFLFSSIHLVGWLLSLEQYDYEHHICLLWSVDMYLVMCSSID